jgi:BirA family transcriptional regulator, biotin operon repressor / biotin---[acetyl-CoA-carboxylase] ligase
VRNAPVPSRYSPPLALDSGAVSRGLDWGVAHELLEVGVAQRARIVARLMWGDRVSGQDLAMEMGISRAAVNKHVQLLRARGLEIEPVPGSGYMLRSRSEALYPEVVLPVLLGAGLYEPGSECFVGFPYRYEPEVPSTNSVAKEMAQEGVPGGALMVAEAQTEGRGRLDRVWVSEPGKDLTLSFLLRPSLTSGEAGAMILASAVAVAGVLSALPGMAGRVGIKWPNDLLVDGRKVAGILTEASMDIDMIHWLVLGLGLNVNSDPARMVPAESLAPGQLPPVSISRAAGTPVHRVLLLAQLTRELSRRWCQVLEGRPADVFETYAAYDALYGLQVTVRSGLHREKVLAEGVADGIGPGGELILRLPGGSTRMVVTGEASLVRATEMRGGPDPM